LNFGRGGRGDNFPGGMEFAAGKNKKTELMEEL
jgi:hypothetical protein